MTTIRWYGPTLLLIATILAVMIGGPEVARQLAYEYRAERNHLVRNELKSNESLRELSDSFRKVSEIVEPSVVHIEVLKKIGEGGMRNWFNAPQEDVPGINDLSVPRRYGNGSGWVYDEDGHIITNNHVIEGADIIRVRFIDGTQFNATVVGSDPKTDIAVLKVNAGKLIAASRAQDSIEQGDIVFAFGSPFEFEFSMSQGIVSAVNRRGLGLLGEIGGYENFIQTDAAINPGNSGGPLTNIYGEVVGMNAAIAARGRTMDEASFSGLAFAIPVKMVEFVAEQLITDGQVKRGYLGVVINDMSPAMAQTFGFSGKGVLVERPNEDGPAYAAGLRRGDIITHINGKRVSTVAELRGIVAAIPPGSTLDVDVYSQGKNKRLQPTISLLPERVVMERTPRLPLASVPSHPAPPTLRTIGIVTTSELTPQLAKMGNLEVAGGIIVRAIRNGSIAATPDDMPSLRRSDRSFRLIPRIPPESIITHVMGKPVTSTEELEDAINSYDLRKGVRMTIVDQGLPQYVLVQLPD